MTLLIAAITATFLFLNLLQLHASSIRDTSDASIISCVGDSITNGSSVNSSSAYPAFLQRHYDEKKIRTMNYGSNGMTVLKVSDHSYWLQEEFNLSMQSNATWVVIQFGTNDAKPSNWNENLFRQDYTNMIELFQSGLTHPAIFLCIPPPIYCPKRTALNEETNTCWKYHKRMHVVNNLLPSIIHDIAFRTGASLVDNFNLLGGEKLSNPEAFFHSSSVAEENWTNLPPYDGIHPNAAGNALMAKNVASIILAHNRRNMKIERFYEHSEVAESLLEIPGGTPLNPSRFQVKHDSVYNHLQEYMKKNPNIDDKNIPMRPLIACVGVSHITASVLGWYSNSCQSISNSNIFKFNLHRIQ